MEVVLHGPGIRIVIVHNNLTPLLRVTQFPHVLSTVLTEQAMSNARGPITRCGSNVHVAKLSSMAIKITIRERAS